MRSCSLGNESENVADARDVRENRKKMLLTLRHLLVTIGLLTLGTLFLPTVASVAKQNGIPIAGLVLQEIQHQFRVRA